MSAREGLRRDRMLPAEVLTCPVGNVFLTRPEPSLSSVPLVLSLPAPSGDPLVYVNPNFFP